MRRPLLPAALVLSLVLAAAPAEGNACPGQPTHTYSGVVPFNGNFRNGAADVPPLVSVFVTDSNTVPCNSANNPTNPMFDGDYDRGAGGAFFGYGYWANEPLCAYDLHVHGGNVQVNDFVYGAHLQFVVGEDDQNGPTIIMDPNGNVLGCLTDGLIDPIDLDDCLSPVYTGTGATCGPGGGDGGYWVFLLSTASAPAPVAGAITAF